MRTDRRKKDRLFKIIISALVVIILSIGINMAEGYDDSDLNMSTKHIQVRDFEEWRSYMLKLTSPDGKVYYTHDINAAYIERRITEDKEPKFRVKVVKNNWFIVALKIRPKYEIVNLGVDY